MTREWALVYFSSYQDTNSIKGFASWHSYWGLGFQHDFWKNTNIQSLTSTLFTFSRYLLSHALVIFACTSHLKILTFLCGFGILLSLEIRRMVWSLLPFIELGENLHIQSHMGMECGHLFYSMCSWIKDPGRSSDSPQTEFTHLVTGERLWCTSERVYCMEVGSLTPAASEVAEPRGSKGRAQSLFLTFEAMWLPPETLFNES